MKKMKSDLACISCKEKRLKKSLQCIDHTVSRETFAIHECLKCGLLMTHPRPDDTLIGKYYASDKYISHTNSNKGLFNKIYQFVRKITLKEKLKLLGNKKGRLLEIGTGTGELLSLCSKSGWKAVGVEPNKKARNIAKKNHSLTIFSSTKKLTINQNSMDKIMLWHVLEHVPDPNETISQIKNWLKKDGEALLAVPNPSSWEAKYYKEFWAAYDVPRHLSHFTQKSMSNLINRHDLKIKKVLPMWFDAFYISMLSEKIRCGKINIFKSATIGLISNLNALIKNNEFSSLIYVIGHK